VNSARHPWLCSLPIPFRVAVISLLYFAVSASVFHYPAWLMAIWNTLSITIALLAVSLLAVRFIRPAYQAVEPC
jgi:hypothetical protein